MGGTPIWVIVFGSSVIAALLTQGLAWLREWLTDRRSGRFSGLRVVLTLEDYARQCAKQISDVHVARGTNGDAGEFHKTLPPIPVIDDMVFDKLDVGDVSAVQSIWVEVARRNGGIALMIEHNEHEQAFDRHDKAAITLGLKCLLVADYIRRRHNLVAEPGLALPEMRGFFEVLRERNEGIRDAIKATIKEAQDREMRSKELPRWLMPFIATRKAIRGPFGRLG